MANDATNKMITLKSSDGEEFMVAEAVAKKAQTLRHLIEDGCAQSSIPLPNVSSKTLALVIEYCKKHIPEEAASMEVSAATPSEKEIEKWDKELFMGIDHGTLFDLVLAANYLNIKELLSLTCKRVADLMKGKSPEEIRTMFNIKNDYTPNEEARVRRENSWAFE